MINTILLVSNMLLNLCRTINIEVLRIILLLEVWKSISSGAGVVLESSRIISYSNRE